MGDVNDEKYLPNENNLLYIMYLISRVRVGEVVIFHELKESEMLMVSHVN